MKKAFGRGEDFDEFIEKKDEMILNPKLDAVRKRQDIGGAIPLDKQVGRPVDISLEDDELFVVPITAPAVLIDPSKPRVRGISLQKQPDRFKYEPTDTIFETDELIIPAEVKALPKPKTLFSMDKGAERFPSLSRSVANLDLSEVMANPAEFKGTDLADISKAYKATLPREPVADFKAYASTFKYRVEIIKEEERKELE